MVPKSKFICCQLVISSQQLICWNADNYRTVADISSISYLSEPFFYHMHCTNWYRFVKGLYCASYRLYHRYSRVIVSRLLWWQNRQLPGSFSFYMIDTVHVFCNTFHSIPAVCRRRSSNPERWVISSFCSYNKQNPFFLNVSKHPAYSMKELALTYWTYNIILIM